MGKHTNGYDPNIGRPEGFPSRSERGGPADEGGCRKAAAWILVVGLGALTGVGFGIAEIVRVFS